MHELPKVLEELFADRAYSEIAFGEQARDARVPGSLDLAEALFELMQARIALRKAQSTERGYTGQWDDKDYWQNEADVYNSAADKFALALKAVLNG